MYSIFCFPLLSFLNNFIILFIYLFILFLLKETKYLKIVKNYKKIEKIKKIKSNLFLICFFKYLLKNYVTLISHL